MPRALIVLSVILVCGLASAEAFASPKTITISLDAGLITFVKTAIWVGGVFLALYATIGVVFFGWDVAKARASLKEAQKEVKEQLSELRQDFREMKDLKEKLEELGAKLQEESENQSTAKPIARPSAPTAPLPPAADSSSTKRTDHDLIHEVIGSSNYEWTTMGRIMKKTGLSREDILSEVRADPDIVISHGRQTQDHIFKFKNVSELLKREER